MTGHEKKALAEKEMKKKILELALFVVAMSALAGWLIHDVRANQEVTQKIEAIGVVTTSD